MEKVLNKLRDIIFLNGKSSQALHIHFYSKFYSNKNLNFSDISQNYHVY